MTFVKRQINLTFLLGIGAYGEQGVAPIQVSGNRVQAHIVSGGGDSQGELQMRVFGLTPDLLARLSALTTVAMMQRKNRVIVSAGDGIKGMSTVFKGDIVQGWADMNAQPDVALQITAYAGMFEKMQAVVPSSYPGPTSVVSIMQNLANVMGVAFEGPNGVTTVLSNPYLPGTAWEQARRCAEAANINWVLEQDVLAIWPKGGQRQAAVPLVSPATGMVGYPAYNGAGISVTTEYNPNIRFGQNVQVESSIKATCGTWNVCILSHSLASETPGGEWFTYFQGNPMNNVNAAPQ